MDITVPESLLEMLERIIAGRDDRLVRDLRAGVPDALIAMGNLLLNTGIGAELAEGCFDLVVRHGNVAASVNLGRALARQPGREADAEQAYLRAAEAGAADAHNNLGNLYARMPGRGSAAERCYRTAIERGTPGAVFNLGLLLAGEAGRENDAEGVLETAISAGHVRARTVLANMLAKIPGREGDAESHFRYAVKVGDGTACLGLANLLALRGGREAEALALYEHAIVQGIVEAHAGAGLMALALCRPVDAERFLRKGVEAGSPEAMNNLGILLLRSGGSPWAESEDLFRRAMDAGNVDAANNLGGALSRQRGREGEACTCLLLACRAGHPTAPEGFGSLLAKYEASGVDRGRLTREAIRGVRMYRGKLPIAAGPPVAQLREALRRASAEQDNATLRDAALLLGQATLLYQAQNFELREDRLPADRVFADAQSLAAVLSSEHVEGKYVYRGQLNRRTAFRKSDLAGNEFAYENVFPHDFRFITRHPGPDNVQFEEEVRTARHRVQADCFKFMLHVTDYCRADLQRGGHHAEWLRSEFREDLDLIAAVPRLSGGGSPAVSIFGDGFKAVRLWRLLWALAQHYELSTALLDVTFSPSIAIWFATHEWAKTQPPPREGRGVVYRFHLPALKGLLRIFEAIEVLQAASLRYSASPRVSPFIQDLRGVPASFAARPIGQQGASLYGLDSLWLLESMSASGVMDVLEFEHGAPVDVPGVSRADIVPPDDPFLPVAQSFRREQSLGS